MGAAYGLFLWWGGVCPPRLPSAPLALAQISLLCAASPGPSCGPGVTVNRLGGRKAQEPACRGCPPSQPEPGCPGLPRLPAECGVQPGIPTWLTHPLPCRALSTPAGAPVPTCVTLSPPPLPVRWPSLWAPPLPHCSCQAAQQDFFLPKRVCGVEMFGKGSPLWW